MTAKDLIISLLEYPLDKEIKVYDRDTKEEKELIYAGASPNDSEAWYDDNEMPHKVNWVEVLIGKSK